MSERLGESHPRALKQSSTKIYFLRQSEVGFLIFWKLFNLHFITGRALQSMIQYFFFLSQSEFNYTSTRTEQGPNLIESIAIFVKVFAMQQAVLKTRLYLLPSKNQPKHHFIKQTFFFKSTWFRAKVVSIGLFWFCFVSFLCSGECFLGFIFTCQFS